MDLTPDGIRESIKLLDKTPGLTEIIDYLIEEQKFIRDRTELAIKLGLRNYSKTKSSENKIEPLEESMPLGPMPRNLNATQEDSVTLTGIEQIFNELAKKWKDETVNLSSIQKITSHSAYLQIIGLGPVAIRLILNELKRAPDFWFCALRALTRTNPVPREMSGDLNAMTKVWLDWGKKHEYL